MRACWVERERRKSMERGLEPVFPTSLSSDFEFANSKLQPSSSLPRSTLNTLFSIFNTHSLASLSFSCFPFLYETCPNYACLSLAAVHEFPTDLFTNKERAEGAVALHVFCVSPPLFCCSQLMFVQSFRKCPHTSCKLIPKS